MFKNMYSVYCVMMVAVMFVLSAPAMATNVAHALVGAVIVTKITGATTTPVAINYNVQVPSLALCEEAKTNVEQAYFSPPAAVTQPLPSENDADKLVFLQCVARAAVAQ